MKTKTPLVTFVVLATILVIAVLSTRAAEQSTVPQLRLHRGVFDAQDLTAQTLGPGTPAPGPYAIIQFRGPITPANKNSLEQTGVTILEYLPDYAYLVRGTDDQLNAAAVLPHVYGRTPFTLADKMAPALLRAVDQGTAVGPVRITGWPDDSGQLALSLAMLPFDTTKPITQAQLLQIAELTAVRWIEPYTQPNLLNDYGRTIMDVNTVWQTTPLYGNGQILAITDSGLDTGNIATLSPDFSGRIVATHILAPGGDWGDQHGHGTHVAGSAAGSGIQSGATPGNYTNSFAGVAPEAGLVIQGFEVDVNGAIIGIPDDYYTLFDQAYGSNARLHSNSWGDVTGPITDTEAMYGGYPYGAQRTDQFLWDHPDMTIFAAAGNSGADGTPGVFGFCTGGDGVVDPDSLLSPATAKNVITVGASESNKNEGPLMGYPWILISLCFLTEPIASDIIANNINGMAAFSSRGPTDDGRSKPDITAPGTNIVSNRSHDPAAGTLWGVHQTNTHYVYSGGTSMATPLTAGMGTLAREWLTGQGAANPSAALVKATLLNTTEDMAPGQYGTGATQEIPYARPNSVAGWGRASLGFVSPPPHYLLWFDDHTTGISTGQSVTYNHTALRPLQVLTTTQPLRIMLVWTDPPASLSASTQLVNDLDLVVTGPGGATYYGNNIPTGDRLNNVEGIIINNPPLGTYQVSVNGFNVPIASQPYALVVAGPLTDSTLPTPTPTNTPTPSNTPTATFTPTPSNTPTFTPTPSNTPTWTPTPTNTPTPTPTGSLTPTPTDTFTPTPTPTGSLTPTPTNTFTPTPTPTGSLTPTPTFTATPSATPTPTGTFTPSATPTATPPPPTFWIYLPVVIKEE